MPRRLAGLPLSRAPSWTWTGPRASTVAAGVSKLARTLLPFVAAAGLANVTGCLSDSYRIRDSELQRLTSLPPEQRGASIRVLQRTSFSSEVAADPAPPAPAPDRPHMAVFIGGAIDVPIGGPGGGGPVRSFAGGPPRSVGPGPVVRGTPGPPAGRVPVAGGPFAGPMPGKVSGDKDAVVMLAVAAVGLTIGSVATEGARFDGVAAAHPAHPVHLMYPDGSQRVTTLWELTPPDTLDVTEAVLSQKEGPIVEGARAPLDRAGVAWRLEGGVMGATLPTGEHTNGGGINLGLGYFPLHWLGFLLHSQFAGGTFEGRDVLDTRLGLEADAFPLALGPVHFGAYGQLGYAWLEADAAEGGTLSRRAWSAGAGGLLEVALTTRLAIVGRVGETFDAPIDGRTPHALAATVGFSVY
jgi:hypothetical protein